MVWYQYSASSFLISCFRVPRESLAHLDSRVNQELRQEVKVHYSYILVNCSS